MEKITVNSFGIEFGYELIAVIPYAYFLHTKGLLKNTISCEDTKDLYYFSPQHEENNVSRSWNNQRKALEAFPNANIHRYELDERQWLPPPYKTHFKNELVPINKMAVVSNKKNDEWGRGVINNLANEDLIIIFNRLRSRGYEIYYNSTYLLDDNKEYDDIVPQLEQKGIRKILSDYGVKTIGELATERGLSYNRMQLALYPHVDLFVSIQGGSSILSSYFGGDNIIYAVEGGELTYNSYNNWYHKFGGSNISHVDNYKTLMDRLWEKTS